MRIKKKLALLLACTLLVTSINVMPVNASTGNSATGSETENAVANTKLSLSVDAVTEKNQGNKTKPATAGTLLTLNAEAVKEANQGNKTKPATGSTNLTLNAEKPQANQGNKTQNAAGNTNLTLQVEKLQANQGNKTQNAAGNTNLTLQVEKPQDNQGNKTQNATGSTKLTLIIADHKWTYTESGNQILAYCDGSCEDDNGGITCGYKGKEHAITLTVNAGNMDYSGNIYEGASVTDNNMGSITNAQVGNITYYLSDGSTKTTSDNSGAESDGSAPKNAGNYVAKVTVTKDSKTYTAEQKFAIIPRKVAKPAQDTTKFIYDGSEQTYIISESDDYTVTNNKQTEPGNYEVTISLTDKNSAWEDGSTNGSTDDLKYTFTIERLDQSVAVVGMEDYEFGGTVSTPSVSGYQETPDVTYYYNTTDSNENGTEWKDISADTLDVGTYYIYAVLSETDHYKAYTTATTEFQVSNGDMTGITADPVEVTYDKTGHGIEVSGYPEGATIMYGTVEGTYELTESPKFTNVGSEAYTVYFKITARGYNTYYGSATVKINPKEVEISWGTLELTYDGTVKVPVATAANVIGTDDISLTVSGGQIAVNTEAVPEYTAEITGITGADAGNYKLGDTGLTTTFRIKNADQEAPEVSGVAETISKKNDGKITGVNSAMEYRKDGDTVYLPISTTEVENLAAGTYYVRYAAKENYNASKDTEVVIGNGRRMTVTLPESQIGYTLAADAAELDWHGSAALTITLAQGYTKTDAFAVKANGTAVKADEDGRYIISNAEDDIIVNVEGVADITAPEAEISIKENKWTTFLNKITFGILFKETIDVTIKAEDNGSGLKDIHYYVADSEMTKDEVKALTDADWTKYTEKFSLEKDNAYVIYVKAEDYAGNIVYLNSDGVIIDKTVPVITGIENDGVYYGDTTFKVADTNLESVTVDGTAVTSDETTGEYNIPADNAEHTIVVTDKSGNQTEYKITVYKIYTVTYVADGKTVATQQIGYGKDAAAPEIPEKTGYNQTAPTWDKDGKNITADTTITAVYTINKYTVTYVADDKSSYPDRRTWKRC